MAQITAADVKKLRQKTGAGMMDCKKALIAVEGKFDDAIDFLRKKGLAASDKKADRIAAEGTVIAISRGSHAVLMEINAETDFVSKNDTFCAFTEMLANLVLDQQPSNIEELMALQTDKGQTVDETLKQLIATIGEKIEVRRFESVRIDGAIAGYVHAGGRIGVLLGIEGEPNDALSATARNIAMHVAAINPQSISRDGVAPEAIERERAVLTERALATGKPAAIVDKIVTGQLNKFFAENCLLEQAFVMDTDKTVAKVIAETQADAKLVVMHRYALGEGIEKRQEDFAAEVAAQVNA